MINETIQHKLTVGGEADEEMEAQTLHQFYLRKKRIITEIRFLSMYGKIKPITPFNPIPMHPHTKYPKRTHGHKFKADKHNNTSLFQNTALTKAKRVRHIKHAVN